MQTINKPINTREHKSSPTLNTQRFRVHIINTLRSQNVASLTLMPVISDRKPTNPCPNSRNLTSNLSPTPASYWLILFLHFSCFPCTSHHNQYPFLTCQPLQKEDAWAPSKFMMVRYKTDFEKFVVVSNCERRSWTRAFQDDDWDFYWANVNTVKQIFLPESGYRLDPHQIINHFPNHYELTRKVGRSG